MHPYIPQLALELETTGSWPWRRHSIDNVVDTSLACLPECRRCAALKESRNGSPAGRFLRTLSGSLTFRSEVYSVQRPAIAKPQHVSAICRSSGRPRAASQRHGDVSVYGCRGQRAALGTHRAAMQDAVRRHDAVMRAALVEVFSLRAGSRCGKNGA